MGVQLLTGFLGSGKTTLLNNILRNKQGRRVAVIENEVSVARVLADEGSIYLHLFVFTEEQEDQGTAFRKQAQLSKHCNRFAWQCDPHTYCQHLTRQSAPSCAFFTVLCAAVWRYRH